MSVSTTFSVDGASAITMLRPNETATIVISVAGGQKFEGVLEVQEVHGGVLVKVAHDVNGVALSYTGVLNTELTGAIATVTIKNLSPNRAFYRTAARGIAQDPITTVLAEVDGDVVSVVLRDNLGRPIVGIRDDGSLTLLGGASLYAGAFVGPLTGDVVGDVPDGSVTNAKLAAGAGVAALIAAGLGNSASYVKTDTGTKTLLAAHATKDRGVLVMVHIDETFAAGIGTAPTMEIGEAASLAKAAATTVFVNAAAGTTFFFGFVNTSTKAIIATLTAAVGVGTGGASITVLALPNS